MTSFDGERIVDLLFAASEDAPPSRVSLAAVLSDGRRRRRRRAVAVPLLVAAAVVGLAAGAVAAVNLRSMTAPPPPPASVGPTVSTPAPTDRVVPTEFPLDRIRAGIDSLGAPSYVRLARGVQYLRYPGIDLLVYALGTDAARAQMETEHGVVPASTADAPPVSGLPARYLYVDDGGGQRLGGIAFQWAPGAWADIFAGAAGEAQLHDLAASLRTDIDEPARFWFTVSPPRELQWAMSVPFSAGDEGNYSSVIFTLDDGLLPPVLSRDHDSYIEVSYGEHFDGPPEQTDTIDGRPARIIDGGGDTYSVELFEVVGTTVKAVNVNVTGTARDRFGPAQAQALALSVVVVGTWDDRSQWTEDPIR